MATKATVLKDKDGTSLYPVTDVSLVVGLQEGAIMESVVVSELPTADATTVGKIYMIPSATVTGEYDRYMTTYSNSAYTWTQLGSTAIPSPVIADNLTTNDATQALSAKQGKVLNDNVTQLGQESKNYVRDFIAKNVVDTTDENYVTNKIINKNGNYYDDSYSGFITTGFIPCSSGDCFRPNAQSANFDCYACFYDSGKNAISSAFIHNSATAYLVVPDNSNIAYVRISHNATNKNCLYNSKEVFNFLANYGQWVLRIDKIQGYEERVSSIENTITTYHLLEEVCERFHKNIFDDSDPDIVEQKYIDSSGNLVSEGSVFTTGYIPCKGGDVLNFQNRVSTRSIICAFYNSDKEFIYQRGEGTLDPYITVPDDNNISYIRICPPNSYRHRALYNYSGTIYGYVPYNSYIALLGNVEFSDQENLISVLDDIHTKIEGKEDIITIQNLIDRSDPDYVNNKLLQNGTRLLDGYNGYEVTGYIPAKSGESFRLNRVLDTTNYKTWWAWYDKDYNVLGYYNDGNSGSHPYLQLPDNNSIAYIRVTIQWNTALYGYLRSNVALYRTQEYINLVKPYGERIIYNTTIGYSSFGNKSLEERVTEIDNHINAVEETVGFWKYACDKILCFGDSLTNGLYAIRPAHGLIQQNYPYYLGKMLNTEVTNKGKNGSYPSECLSVVYPTVTITDYNTIIIWLGTNGGLKIAESVSGLSNVSPEAQYLKYKELIETIQTGNPDCKIFIGKVFRTGEISSGVTPGTVEETNAAIEALATEYGLPIIDFSDLTPANHPELHVNTSDTHFGKAGNIFIANRVCKTFEVYFGADPLRCEFGLNPKQSIW